MNRDIFWSPVAGVGIESLHLIEDSTGIVAESVVIGSVDGASFRLHYEVECDRQYHVQRVNIATLGRKSESITLRADGGGKWADGQGEEVSALNGCIDVDISVTPFSNTLPIRRLKLDQNESAEVQIAYITVPELRIEAVSQRYTCLDPIDENGGLYRYESISSGFTAELPVDSDGLIIDYPGLFDRVLLS
ncbi:putative glycolipid-binding domain-containing protein [Halostagnicola sp. A-GB9-2]|uniref:putative glycolipid-binding domain-containing protein n=1 Tax=Halostagnicola sp. A-GB9-2 TaxID=3048066 RepID=UPI0024C040A2|nr:putative glycolipid-binding domain-containing protein [Halostagnicola sp. A-GB9-2]MDJ1431190.1 putative glycolipid-binding domain-containing protein [Halostagnicola sp. A-GB9-2]